MAKPETILLLGNYRATLAFAREVALLGYRIVVTKGGGEGLSEYSRFVDEVWNEPHKGLGEDACLSGLDDFLRRRTDIVAVVPVTEQWAIALANGVDRLPADRLYVAPRPHNVRNCLDKPSFLERAIALGLPVPETRIVSDYGSLSRALSQINAPVVIRSLTSELRLCGQKTLNVPDARSLSALLPSWPEGHDTLIVQEKVHGRRHNIYFAAKDGQMIRALQTDIEKTDAADGTGLAVKGQTIPFNARMLEGTRLLLKDLNYHGIGCAQFLFDDERKIFHVLEINPRVAGHHTVPVRAGLELGALAIQLARGDEIPPTLETGKVGLHYTWTYGALRGLRTMIGNRTTGLAGAISSVCQILVDGIRSDIAMTWRWDDPLPTMLLFSRQFFPAAQRAGHRRPDRPSDPAQSRTATING